MFYHNQKFKTIGANNAFALCRRTDYVKLNCGNGSSDINKLIRYIFKYQHNANVLTLGASQTK
jgi:hypothetical protein